MIFVPFSDKLMVLGYGHIQLKLTTLETGALLSLVEVNKYLLKECLRYF